MPALFHVMSPFSPSARENRNEERSVVSTTSNESCAWSAEATLAKREDNGLISSCENLNPLEYCVLSMKITYSRLKPYTHALPPPRKVILHPSVRRYHFTRERKVKEGQTYKLEQTRGILASMTPRGTPSPSHRSGLHSVASAPQIALFLLHE